MRGNGAQPVLEAFLEPSKPLLHLGAGRHHLPGFLNCDREPAEGIDLAFDLMQPWPLADNSCDAIYASHVLEHLPDHCFFFREAWRVLDDRRQMRIRVPSGTHRLAWCDPTHVRPWYPESFAFLQPGYGACVNNPQHGGWDTPFLVVHIGQKISGWVMQTLRWHWLFHLVKNCLQQVPDAIEELWCELYTLKSPLSVEMAIRAHPGNTVPFRFLMLQTDWERRTLPNSPWQLLDVTGRQICRAY